MPLEPGVRLGPYEISRLIGAGGMGEVYQARDTRLDRIVAIKVLSEGFAADPDRRVRFEREARAVAALSHAHICALHDVGEMPALSAQGEPLRYLVMEHLEGQTLAERLVRGPLPVTEVMRYAIELADALDHAHRRGLVHRDLKPGNVMLTKGGAKLLDFGLSKLHTNADLLTLSTISPGDVPLTKEGAVLGTFPYMSPEQLAGREADPRSDIFAFGAIVHEMATGRRAFDGTTAATVIGAVLHTDPPPVSSVQTAAPSALDRILARCLAKEPDDRWQNARDLLLELKWLSDHADSPAGADAAHARSRSRWSQLGIAAAIATVAVAAGIAYASRGAPADGPLVRLAFSPPDELKLAEVRFTGPVTISPDGRRLAYVAAGPDGRQLLRLHSLESSTAQALPGTDDAAYPFWSPDSRFIGFFSQGKLKRIDTNGGPPQILCDAVLPRGGTWNRDGVILFASNGGQQLFRVPAAGGSPVAVRFARPNPESHWPAFLPDGRHFVYFGRRTAPGIYVASIDSAETKLLLAGQYVAAAFAPPGYLILQKGGAMAGTLTAQRFDPDRQVLIGEPTAFAEDVAFYPFYGRGDFSVSANGTLIYGTPSRQTTQIRWFDRAGRTLGDISNATGFERPTLSPDETTVAAQRLDPATKSQDIWLLDTTRGVSSRLTSDPALDGFLVWSPDGRDVVYGSARADSRTLYKRAFHGGAEEKLYTFDASAPLIKQTTQWSRDGRFIVYGGLDPKSLWDLWVLPVREPSGKPEPVRYLQTQFNEHHGQLSPDGKWMAYTSDESGQLEVYVGSFPSPDTRVRVSANGGTEPQWRADGHELFYLASDSSVVAAAVQTQPVFTVKESRPLFTIRNAPPAALGWNPHYIPSRDGQRFLINAVEDVVPSRVTVVMNWPSAFKP